MSIRVLICDDDSLIRESLKIILPLKGDIEIIGEASNGRECKFIQKLVCILASHPDVPWLNIKNTIIPIFKETI